MSNSKGVGAPKGGRVHWFLLEFPKMLREYYHVQYNYDKHNYLVIRKGIENIDMFLVVRTSQRCWRVTYFDTESGYSEYKSFLRLYEIYDYMYYFNGKKIRLELERKVRREMEDEKKGKKKPKRLY